MSDQLKQIRKRIDALDDRLLKLLSARARLAQRIGRLKQGAAYPYRSLLPRPVDNLLVAGRCASMTHDGQSSARVSGPCFAMGQAAGTAADLALKAGVAPRDVDVRALQRRLEANGAYLGTNAEMEQQVRTA